MNGHTIHTTSSLKRIRPSSPTPSNSSSCSEISNCLSDFESRRARLAPLRVAIEGNIAAGKSTFLNIIQELVNDGGQQDWYIQPEPLSKWTKADEVSKNGGGNLLDAFYKDPKRWAYTFEAYTFITRMQQANDAQRQIQADADLHESPSSSPPITFFERSVYSSRLVFAENSFESGYLDTTEWALYCDWSSFLLKTVKQLKLDGIIYLQCQPSICVERMKKRSRDEESAVPLAYLTALHEKYESWLNGWMQNRQNLTVSELKQSQDLHLEVKRALMDVPVLVLNCDLEFESDFSRRDQMVQQVKKFLIDIQKDNDDGIDENINHDVHNDIPNPLDMIKTKIKGYPTNSGSPLPKRFRRATPLTAENK